jgi:hypothetical protein
MEIAEEIKRDIFIIRKKGIEFACLKPSGSENESSDISCSGKEQNAQQKIKLIPDEKSE